MLKSLIENLNSQTLNHKPALIYDDRIVSYGELNEKILRSISFIKSQKKDTLPILLSATPESIAFYLGACFTSKRVIPIGENLLKHQRNKLSYAIGNYGLYDEKITQDFSPVELKETETEIVFHTSSSTSQETKAVVVNLSYWKLFEDWFKKSFSVTEEDRFLLSAPLHFDMSLVDLFIPLSLGATVVIPKKGELFYLDEFIKLIRDKRVTFVHSVPSLWQNLVLSRGYNHKSPFHLRKILYAGESLTPYYYNKLKCYFPDSDIHNIYGQTETNSFLHYKINSSQDLKYPSPFGSTDTFCKVTINSDSEMLVSGENIAKGYLDSSILKSLGNPHNTRDRISIKNGIAYYLGRKSDLTYEPLSLVSEINSIAGVIQSIIVETTTGAKLFYQDTKNNHGLLSKIKNLLPEHMDIEGRSFFPLNYNGKIDRNGLATARPR